VTEVRRRQLELVLSIVAIVVVAAGLWLAAIRPQSNRAAKASTAEEIALDRQSALRNDIVSLNQLKAQAPKLTARETELKRLFPTDPKLANLTDALQDTAQAAGVTLVSIQPGTPADAGIADSAAGTARLAGIPLQIQVGGGYFQVGDFLDRVENLVRNPASAGLEPRAMLVQSIDLSKAGTGDTGEGTGTLTDPNSLQARVSLVAYQNLAAGAVAAAPPGAGASTATPRSGPSASGPTTSTTPSATTGPSRVG
jgi:type IV pilus assembly protein PilO